MKRSGSDNSSKVATDVDEKEGKMSKKSRNTLFILFFSLVLDLLGFTVILPLMPSILEYYGRSDGQDGLYGRLLAAVDGFRDFIGAPQTQKFNIVLFGGLLGSLFSFLQFVASPLIGSLSDVYGRRAIMITTMVGVVMSYVLWAVSYSFPVFIVARIVGGISKGNVSLSAAIVTDITTPAHRSKGMAAIAIAFCLGFLFGPTIGAMFSILGSTSEAQSYSIFQYPALFSLCMAAGDVLLIYALLPETLPSNRRAKSLGYGVKSALQLINPVSLFRFDAMSKITKLDRQNLQVMGVAYFLYLLLFSGLEYSLTFLCHQVFNYTSIQQGKMFLFIGVVMTLVQGGYVRRRPSGSEKQTALQGMLLLMPGMFIIGRASSIIMLYVGLVLFSFGAGTVVPSMTSLTSEFGEGDEKGKVMGIFRSLGALARALGPTVACAVYWRYGAEICYSFGAMLMLVPLFIFSFVERPVAHR
ncbi:major facilitator superfamily domain-containing protein 10-like [Dysidea avara]|uniref:major facilitator superfamily domain-containing protein 10-like n=1 Tax=Dysidea avara TaxID=196820 RepID=UPI00332FD229